MLNKKFLTRLLNLDFRKKVMAQYHKYIESNNLKLKQYATYVVDKHNKERDISMKDVKTAYYGFSPIDVIAYVAKDGSIKKSVFEFNTINHFLVKNDYATAVDVTICILAQLVNECKKDVAEFNIDKIDADAKKLEEEYLKKQEEAEKAQGQDDEKGKSDAAEKIH